MNHWLFLKAKRINPTADPPAEIVTECGDATPVKKAPKKRKISIMLIFLVFSIVAIFLLSGFSIWRGNVWKRKSEDSEATLKFEIENYKKEIDKIEADFASYRGINSSSEEYLSLQKLESETESRVSSLAKDIQNYDKETGKLYTKIENQERLIQILKTDAKILSAENQENIQNYQKSIEQIKSENQEKLHNLISENQEKVQKLKSENQEKFENFEISIDKLKSKNADLTTDFENIFKLSTDLTKKLNLLKEDNSELTRSNSKLAADKSQLIEINSKLTNYNNKLDEDYRNRVKDIKRLQANITVLEEQNKNLTETLYPNITPETTESNFVLSDFF